ncbi:MAG: DNA-binding protein [Chloroflexota bacterium]
MALSTAAFKRIGVSLDPHELDRLIAEAVSAVLPGAALGAGSELTPEEVAALERGGLRPAPPPEGVRRVLARSAAEYAALIGSAYTVAETAHLLGIDGSRIRHRLAAHTLYGVKHTGSWRLPRFQFDGDRLVPGIEHIFPSLEPGMHPLAITRWFTAPDPDLALDGIALSPRDWLLAGGDPQMVAAITADLGLGA